MLGVREDVVGNDYAAGLDEAPGEMKERLVVLLLGVQEDHVENVVDRTERRVRVTLAEFRPLL